MAEGFEAVFPYDAARTDPRWQKFNTDYAAIYHEKPEQFASLAYDAMNVLLGSVCEAGLNKGRIMDSLAQVYEYDGVTGHMVFDTNSKNIAPMYLARVHNGTIEYRRASMEPKPAQWRRQVRRFLRLLRRRACHMRGWAKMAFPSPVRLKLIRLRVTCVLRSSVRMLTNWCAPRRS